MLKTIQSSSYRISSILLAVHVRAIKSIHIQHNNIIDLYIKRKNRKNIN
jgi:hypothetical protein